MQNIGNGIGYRQHETSASAQKSLVGRAPVSTLRRFNLRSSAFKQSAKHKTQKPQELTICEILLMTIIHNHAY